MAEIGTKSIVVGLTGGIGSGKSSVLKTLIALGAEGIDADQVAHEVMAPGGPAYQPVVDEFGMDVLDLVGRIDRQVLAQRVFGNSEALRRLESIIHPAVYQVVKARVADSPAPLVIIEAIKLLEAGLSRMLCDQVWVTVARPEQQVARLVAGRGMSAEEVERRVAAQMPAEEMARQSQRVIDTSGTLADTGLQVFKAWSDLGLPFPAPSFRPGTSADAEGIAAVLNSVVREGGLSVIDRTLTVDEERAFLRGLHPRARLTVANMVDHIIGFQTVDVYATYTSTMDHVAAVGTFVAPGLRGCGIGRGLAETSVRRAREAGFRKFVIGIRADNTGAQVFYGKLGFQPCGRLSRQALVDGHYVDELLYELFI